MALKTIKKEVPKNNFEPELTMFNGVYETGYDRESQFYNFGHTVLNSCEIPFRDVFSGKIGLGLFLETRKE